MKPFFTPDLYPALIGEVQSWAGTRFSARVGGRAVKGVKADCVTFVEAVLVNLGAISPLVFPPYVPFTGGPDMFSLMVGVVESVPTLEKLTEEKNPASLIPGDVLLCSTGTAGHHLALFVGDATVWHCIDRYGVTETSVNDPIVWSRVRSIHRPIRITR